MRSNQPFPIEPPKPLRKWQRGPRAYLFTTAAVLLATAIAKWTHADASLVNIPPLYLLVVQGVALMFGSRAAIVAAILAFLAFDFFFVEPRFQFTVRDPFEFVALCVFLATGLLVGQLTGLLRRREQDAQERALFASTLAKASWTVASELDAPKALTSLLSELSCIDGLNYAAVTILLDESESKVIAQYLPEGASAPDLRLYEDAQKFVYAQRQSVGWDDGQHWEKVLPQDASSSFIVLPVSKESEVQGIFIMRLHGKVDLGPEQKKLVEAILNHVAVVLQRDKLLQAQADARALQETNKLKTALLQMVSHDFRSPLASIKTNVTTLAASTPDSPVDEPVRKVLLDSIEEESDRLNRMVGNLLDLSRLEAKAWETRREAFSVTELIGVSLDSFNELDNNRIEIANAAGETEVESDFVQMTQVMRNLLENALKYSPTTSRVEFSINKDGGAVLFKVRDHGAGLPKNQEDKIFEPFFRAKEHQESAFPGLGMGLAVCKGLVEVNGGTLSAYNSTEGGAVFCVRLPLKEQG